MSTSICLESDQNPVDAFPKRRQLPARTFRKFNGIMEMWDDLGIRIGEDNALHEQTKMQGSFCNKQKERQLDQSGQSQIWRSIFRLWPTVDKKRHDKSSEEMENNHTVGNDKFPRTMNETCDVHLHFENHDGKRSKSNDGDNNNENDCTPGLSFNDMKMPERALFEDWCKTATCNECHEKGHI